MAVLELFDSKEQYCIYSKLFIHVVIQYISMNQSSPLPPPL